MTRGNDKTQDTTLRQQLALARLGQDYFSRKLDELTDADFDTESALPGWSRRHVIAHVGLNARALANLTTWAGTGVETPMYTSPAQRNDDIERAATLPAEELRKLSADSAAHLDAGWRDLEPDAWSHHVRTAQGSHIPASEAVWMRAREVWIHAVDLDNGGSFSDFPAAFIDRLLGDVLAEWDRRRQSEPVPAFVLRLDDRAEPLISGDAAEAVRLSGATAGLAAWATGRSSTGVTAENGEVPAAPRWL
ncbi:maleylpyruvate isomerase family mycothiol-dependent enzyme [Mycetocola sp.]|uniref:maleylpyruvate isomerase family mycothiol-dependent enzyme n=1 Tax=Mycetocola sp. TaxID=1871042 RepID=UPI002626A94F|nr:maleylpyruvate isomerase family mycothiol-dependent enzyme [Mycetocola sp.]MCU1560545.1 mycothiol-dependent maleylpyruvate isomerase [Mycetocola sp.]